MTERSDVNALPSNLVRTMPYVAYVSTLSHGLVFANYSSLALFAALAINEGSNHLAKFVLRRAFGPEHEWIKRPAGAMDTGIYPAHQPKVSTTSGMPSGHAQTSFFMASLLVQHLIVHPEGRGVVSVLASCVFVLAVASLVAMSRTKHGGRFTVHVNGVQRPPHTTGQVVVGAAIGAMLGILAFQTWLRM